ncbi:MULTISPECIES: cyclic-phosphate processing receiver domain-containing protein [Bacillales]|uniref:cyclic-phosphate processing receiver domain-containing protein n=1 Tax=Bacillales TaxID=1385 RepID=UPI0006A7C6FF|nr:MULTISPECIES: cyclic-phosphate processing receiver domain-containing protein [Bacillales]OBZ17401.1 cell division protein FtsJ [Bacillus sp. FJAT-26390]
MIHVYLDDYRTCPKGFVLASNAEECKQLLDLETIGILSLDYDLGWAQPTGYEVVRHIVETGRYPEQIFLHTSSAAGRMQMYHMLSTNAPAETKLHNGPMTDALLNKIAGR